MERIGRYTFDDDFPAKTVSFCAAETLDGMHEQLHFVGPFVLFLAIDSTQFSAEDVYLASESLLKKGMVYLCVWGPDCERFHDICDEAIVSRNPNETERSVVMTTWHSKESLEEAVWFFLHCAWPAADFERHCADWVAAVIGKPEWETRVKRCLATGPDLEEEY